MVMEIFGVMTSTVYCTLVLLVCEDFVEMMKNGSGPGSPHQVLNEIKFQLEDALFLYTTAFFLNHEEMFCSRISYKQ